MKTLYLIFALGTSISRGNSFYHNENVTICEKPSSINHMTHIEGSPYFLNYGDEWPKSYLTILIWERDIPSLEINPATYFSSNDVCINGNITFYNQSPQITLNRFDQIIPRKNL